MIAALTFILPDYVIKATICLRQFIIFLNNANF